MDDLTKATMLFGCDDDDEDEDESLWDEVEEKCEGKTISTLSADGRSGIIIRFTDGSKFSMICGQVSFEEPLKGEKS